MNLPFERALIISFVFCVFSATAFQTISAQSSTRSKQRNTASRGKVNNRIASSSNVRAGSSTRNATGFALFELFTSEGCSSCPPADANLARLNNVAHSDRIYTLSYHVDYWDYLGWKDPFGDEIHSKRQREYARAFKSKSVYTPQMVINGSAEFNGSNQKTSDQALKIALNQTPDVEFGINAKLRTGKVDVGWKSSGLKSTDIVNIALVQNQAQQFVNAGENSRKSLSHVNVVRNFKTIEKPQTNGAVTLSLPENFEAPKFHLIGFIQSKQTGQIKNAAKFDFPLK